MKDAYRLESLRFEAGFSMHVILILPRLPTGKSWLLWEMENFHEKNFSINVSCSNRNCRSSDFISQHVLTLKNSIF
jgi:hypothetical protein